MDDRFIERVSITEMQANELLAIERARCELPRESDESTDNDSVDSEDD